MKGAATRSNTASGYSTGKVGGASYCRQVTLVQSPKSSDACSCHVHMGSSSYGLGLSLISGQGSQNPCGEQEAET